MKLAEFANFFNQGAPGFEVVKMLRVHFGENPKENRTLGFLRNSELAERIMIGLEDEMNAQEVFMVSDEKTSFFIMYPIEIMNDEAICAELKNGPADIESLIWRKLLNLDQAIVLQQHIVKILGKEKVINTKPNYEINSDFVGFKIVPIIVVTNCSRLIFDSVMQGIFESDITMFFKTMEAAQAVLKILAPYFHLYAKEIFAFSNGKEAFLLEQCPSNVLDEDQISLKLNEIKYRSDLVTALRLNGRSWEEF